MHKLARRVLTIMLERPFIDPDTRSPQNADHADCRPCRVWRPCRMITFILILVLHLLLTSIRICFGSGHKLVFNYISECLLMHLIYRCEARGGDPRHNLCGAFDLHCLPNPWLRIRVPGWGCLHFCLEEWDQVILSHVNNGKNLPKAKPPSEIFLEAHNKWKGIPDNSAVLAIAKETLLPLEEVCLRLRHLEDVACNCNRGVKKAVTKWRECQTNWRQKTDMSSVCHTCNIEEPLLEEGNNDKDGQHMNG